LKRTITSQFRAFGIPCAGYEANTYTFFLRGTWELSIMTFRGQVRIDGGTNRQMRETRKERFTYAIFLKEKGVMI